jgi:hypothetical protein
MGKKLRKRKMEAKSGEGQNQARGERHEARGHLSSLASRLSSLASRLPPSPSPADLIPKLMNFAKLHCF